MNYYAAFIKWKNLNDEFEYFKKNAFEIHDEDFPFPIQKIKKNIVSARPMISPDYPLAEQYPKMSRQMTIPKSHISMMKRVEFTFAQAVPTVCLSCKQAELIVRFYHVFFACQRGFRRKYSSKSSYRSFFKVQAELTISFDPGPSFGILLLIIDLLFIGF